MKPNLNNLKERIEFVVNGGKVRFKTWGSESYIMFCSGRFVHQDGESVVNDHMFFCDKNPLDWLEYQPPKKEDDLRGEFEEKLSEIGLNSSTIDFKNRRVADLLFDTFEPKKKKAAL